MTGNKDTQGNLDERIEHTRIRLMNDQQMAKTHASAFRRSLLSSLSSPGALMGAFGAGFVLERTGVFRSKRPKGRDDRKGPDRRRSSSSGSLLTLKNVMTVATTSLALLQKLDKKKVEAQKEKAEAQKEKLEARVETSGADNQGQQPSSLGNVKQHSYH